MVRNKIIFILLLLATLMGCIKLYEPDYQPDDNYRIVVEGVVTSIEGIQEISLHYTSPLRS